METLIQVASQNAPEGSIQVLYAHLATTTALPANTYSNGTLGVGATLTAQSNGTIPNIDGVAPSVGNYLLIQNESNTYKNGLYVVTSIGSAGAPWVLTRATGMDTSTEFYPAHVDVAGGNTLARKIFFQTSQNVSVGTTGVVFSELALTNYVPNTRTLTINGTSYELSADRTWTITSSVPNAINIFVDSVNGVDSTGRGDINTPYLTIEYALSQITNTGTITGNITTSSSTITGISDVDNTKLQVGMVLSVSGLPFNTTIITKNSEGSNANTIVVSNSATSTTSSLSISYIKQYIIECNGTFKPSSNIFKDGVYIKNNGRIIWGNFALYSNSSVLKTSYYILGDGVYNGIHASSTFCSLTGTQTAGMVTSINFGEIKTIGTGTCLTTSTGTNENYTIVKGRFVDVRFGTVGSFTGYSQKLDFNSYGLLGGITTVNSTTSASVANNTIFGTHQTPSSVTVLTAGIMTVSYGNYRGNVVMSSGYTSHIGRISGTSHTFGSGCNIKATGRSSGTFTCSGTSTIEFSNPSEVCTLVVSSGATIKASGEYILTGTNNIVGILHNFGTILNGNLNGTGTIYNYGSMSITDTNSFTGTIENHGIAIFSGIVPSTGGLMFLNYGRCLLNTYGIIFNGASTFINQGTIESNGIFSNNTAMIKLNSASCAFDNWGRIIMNETDVTKAVIEKVAGKLLFRPGSIIKVSNSKSPIRCTANTSDSKDIYLFGLITNCNSSTYGALIAFDGTSYTPNDLVGGTIYENINY